MSNIAILTTVFSAPQNSEARDIVRYHVSNSFLTQTHNSNLKFMISRRSWGNPDIPGVETRLAFLIGRRSASAFSEIYKHPLKNI